MRVYCEDCLNVILESEGLRYAKCKAYMRKRSLQFVGRKLMGTPSYCDSVRWRKGCRKYKPKEKDNNV